MYLYPEKNNKSAFRIMWMNKLLKCFWRNYSIYIYLNEFHPLPKVYVSNDANFWNFFLEITFKTNVIDSEENQTRY